MSTIQGDLANITAPPFFLAPVSVVEIPRCWAQYPDIFVAPAAEDAPARRCLAVLQLFLVGLRDQLYVAGAPDVSIKKPLNAFLGEVFLASWTNPKSDETTRLVSEQVSHHPPITAVHISSQERGVRADGYARVEMTFNGSFNVRQIGHTVVHVDRYDEDFFLPLPRVQVRGFLSACLYPEVLGTHTITSSSGYVAEIEFYGTGLISSKKRNSFKARVYHRDEPKASLYEVSGVWSESWKVKDGRTGKTLNTHRVDDPANAPAPVDVEPEECQDPWESRRAWQDVTQKLRGGSYHAASVAKHKIEEGQRQMRKEEKRRGDTWEPLLFKNTPGDQYSLFSKLTEGLDVDLEDHLTKGVWRIDDEKLDSLQKPYRQGSCPSGSF